MTDLISLFLDGKICILLRSEDDFVNVSRVLRGEDIRWCSGAKIYDDNEELLEELMSGEGVTLVYGMFRGKPGVSYVPGTQLYAGIFSDNRFESEGDLPAVIDANTFVCEYDKEFSNDEI